VLADRYPKRWLIFWMQACFMALAVVLTTLVLSGLVQPWHLLALAAASGLVNAVDFPARLSFVMEMVGRRDLMNAVGLNASLFNGARAVGPAIGGLMLAWVGPGWCFGLNTLTYAGVLVGLARMDIAETVVPAPHAARGVRYVLAGFGYVARNPRLALSLVLVGAIGFFGWPFLSLMPAFSHDVLGVRERGYSVLLSATGFGALAAALSVASFGSIERRRWFIATGVSMIAIMLLALSISTRIETAAVCCGLIGFGLIIFFATCQSVMQLAAEDHNRGRVMGVWSMVVSGAQPLGNFLAGPAADQYGEPIVLRVEGLACAIAMVGTIALVYLMDRERVRADAELPATALFDDEVR
jgi:MFS family permease